LKQPHSQSLPYIERQIEKLLKCIWRVPYIHEYSVTMYLTQVWTSYLISSIWNLKIYWFPMKWLLKFQYLLHLRSRNCKIIHKILLIAIFQQYQKCIAIFNKNNSYTIGLNIMKPHQCTHIMEVGSKNAMWSVVIWEILMWQTKQKKTKQS